MNGHDTAWFGYNRQKLLFPLSMLSLEPECDFHFIFQLTITCNRESRLNDENTSKDAKQHDIEALLTLNSFSEDTVLVKCCF